jgi:flagellin
MQINHNINAMITQHALYNNNSAMSKSLEKLSTGLKINRAQDDAAGLAMSEQMRTQIKGLGKARQNSLDGIAALQIAEGGLAEITNIMQRQRELAIQSANDTLTSTERKYLDLEFQELTKEVARIAKTTDYNGKNMLNWSSDPNLSFGAIGDKYELQREVRIEVDKVTSLAEAGFTDAAKTTPTAPATTPASWSGASGYDLVMDAIKCLNTIASADPAVTLTIRQDPDNPHSPYPPPGVYDKPSDLVAPPVGGPRPDSTGTSMMYELQHAIDMLKANLDEYHFPAEKDRALAEALHERLNIIVNNNAQPSTDSLLFLFSNMLENDMTQAASYTLHIGPNYSFGMGGKWANEMTVTYISLNPGSLGLSTKNIRTQNNSTEVIDHLDRVIKSVSGVRAKIGTYINRLEYTINNISSLEFNTQDAESRIRDTDFAAATTEFTRNQILVQSATSMLAQANTLPQTALSLING